MIMENLPGHTGPRVREMIDAAGASLLYLPPYRRDLNPVEKAFAKLKAFLAKPPREPSTTSGKPSVVSSIFSQLTNAKTTSLQLATMQTDGIPLY